MDVVVGEDSVDCCVVILFDSGGCKAVGRDWDGVDDVDECVVVLFDSGGCGVVGRRFDGGCGTCS